jgi:hypothetical protein
MVAMGRARRNNRSHGDPKLIAPSLPKSALVAQRSSRSRPCRQDRADESDPWSLGLKPCRTWERRERLGVHSEQRRREHVPRPAVNDPEAALGRPGAAGRFRSSRGGALRVEPLRDARMTPNAASASPRRAVPVRGGPRIHSVFSHLSHSFSFRLVPAMAPTHHRVARRGAAPRSR